MNCNVLALPAWGTLAISSFLAAATARAEDLLANSSFAKQEDGAPIQWSIRDNKQEVAVDTAEASHPEIDQALRVDIVRDGGSSYGQIAQAVSVKPNTVYCFTGDWRSSKGRTAFFQIKRIKDRKELERIHLGWSSPAWQRVVRLVNSGEADTIEVICRYRFWSNPGPARLQNCIAAYAVDYRSGNPGIGLWQAKGSYVRVERSTFYANGTAVRVEADGSPTRCELLDCILAGEQDAKLLAVESGGEVSKTNTVEGIIGNAETDPQLTAPTPEWNGKSNAFNSRRFPNCGASF
jgi:hypothetical protein